MLMWIAASKLAFFVSYLVVLMTDLATNGDTDAHDELCPGGRARSGEVDDESWYC